MRITGIAALPVSDDGGSSQSGAYLPEAAADELGFGWTCDDSASCYRNISVGLADGVDLAEIL